MGMVATSPRPETLNSAPFLGSGSSDDYLSLTYQEF